MTVKKKFGTTLEEELLYELKLLAAKENKRISQILEEALRQYLRRKRGGVVQRTRGALQAPASVVQAVLEEEAFYGAP